MNAQLQAAIDRKTEHDAVFADACNFLDGLLGVPVDAKGMRHGTAIVMTYSCDQKDIDLAADMMSHQFNQFNWTAAPGTITVEWGVS
jgi:hypothetical protein